MLESTLFTTFLQGKNLNPSAVKLARIANVLGVSVNWLVGVAENEGLVVPDSVVRHAEKGYAEARFVTPSDSFIKLSAGDKLLAIG